MSAISDRALLLAKPVAIPSGSMRVPLFGVLWVVVNVALVGLGICIHYPFACSFLAGLLNGTLLSVIVVSMASERFQAGATGLLGGLSLSGLRNDGSMIWKAMQGIHGVVDSALGALGVQGGEKLHNAIEQEALYMVWTSLFVMLASLVAEWARHGSERDAQITCGHSSA
jgi:hypothetical protein